MNPGDLINKTTKSPPTAKEKKPRKPREPKEPKVPKEKKPRKPREPKEPKTKTPKEPRKRKKDQDDDDELELQGEEYEIKKRKIEKYEEEAKLQKKKRESIEEDEESEGDEDDFLDEKLVFSMEEKEEEDEQSMDWKEIENRFTPAQVSRHAAYRRSTLHKPTVKKIMTSVSGGSVNEVTSIVMGGIAKLFAGEIIELARKLMTEASESGPIRLPFLQEALRLYKNEGKIPYIKKRRLFTRR